MCFFMSSQRLNSPTRVQTFEKLYTSTLGEPCVIATSSSNLAASSPKARNCRHQLIRPAMEISHTTWGHETLVPHMKWSPPEPVMTLTYAQSHEGCSYQTLNPQPQTQKTSENPTCPSTYHDLSTHSFGERPHALQRLGRRHAVQGAISLGPPELPLIQARNLGFSS